VVRQSVWLFMVVGLVLLSACAEGAEDSLLFDAPKLSDIAVDGSPDDWGGEGFEVGIMTTPDGTMLAPHDFDASFRLGWDDRGLLLLVSVRDDAPVESEDIGSLWTKDSIEAFVAVEVGGPDYYQVAVAPGRTESHPDMRYHVYDFRKTEPKKALSVQAARSLTATGYVMEILFPWTNLARRPDAGDAIGFQLFVNDADGAADRFQVQFYPLSTAHNSSRMHRIRLATTAGPHVLAKGKPEFARAGRLRLNVVAAAELMGAEIEAKAGSRTVAGTALVEKAGRAGATVLLAELPDERTYDTVTLHARGMQIGSLSLPDAEKSRARALMETPVNFNPFVFVGTTFPQCAFERPREAEGLLGAYTIKTTFYARDYAEVTSAETPGRYGAVVDVVPERGRTMRRFRTVFRLPESADGFSWWRFQGDASVSLPEEYGISPTVVDEHHEEVSRYIWRQFYDGFRRDRTSAALIAGLYEAAPTGRPVRANLGAEASDRQWWVGLKRKLYGADARWPDAFVCPQPIDGEPAQTLHSGTAEQAGMLPDAGAEIDALLREWAANSDEAFAVCLARDGVIFLQEAYGDRDGKPMTLTTKSWMASITKLLSGTLMMMCVDQGLVDLDDPVDTYLRPFRGVEVENPLTVRHLYTHTNGLWGHWGDDLHDFEEIVAEYYPFLDVGTEHLYNGAGYALGGKIIETVTGEAVPTFFVNHLLEPLGCEHTDVLDTSATARSVPLDIAKIGQMLLNQGAYGHMRFFSEETFEKMMPEKLTELLGPAGEGIEWGIGVVWMNVKGFGEKTFGHGAASAATLLIDPDNKLVIVMTRDSAGKNFTEYNERFLSAIVANLASPT
jgi:CubicO group peptidase (beta-lactamase class C family)